MENINASTFFDVIKEGVVIVDVYGNFCGPCKLLMPKLERVEKELGITIYKMDVEGEGNKDLIKTNFAVSSIPTLLFFKDGELKNKISGGLLTEDQIKDAYQAL